MHVLLVYLTAFTLTFLIEWPLFALLSRKGFRRTAFFLLLMNLVSWPLLAVAHNYTEIHILWLELGVVLLETFIIFISWRFAWWKCFLLALTINAASYFIGTPLCNLILNLES